MALLSWGDQIERLGERMPADRGAAPLSAAAVDSDAVPDDLVQRALAILHREQEQWQALGAERPPAGSRS